MSKHLLHLVLDGGLTLRFECLSPGSPECATHYENLEPRPEDPPLPEGCIAALRRDGYPQFVRYVDGNRTYEAMTPEQAEMWTTFWEAEEEYEPWVAKLNECWVETHVLECVAEGTSVAEFLEELEGVGVVNGPIPVVVWNDGDFEECIPRMRLWKEKPDGTE